MAQNPQDARIEVQIPVRPEFAKYIDLLAAPSYVLIALDNIKASPLSGGRVTIQDAASFGYRIIEARFAGSRGTVYRYEGKLEWNLAVTTAALSAAMELDIASLAEGRVSVRVLFPLAGILPSELTERIRGKLAMMGDAGRQDRLLAYLSDLSKRAETARPPKPSLFELILVDAHNQSMALGDTVREPGDAEPLSDQAMLLATLAIWLVAVPAVVVLRRRWLARRAKARSG